MTSNAVDDTYEDTVGTTAVRWPRVYNPVIGLACPRELGGCGAAPGNLCTRAAGLVEARRGLRRVSKRCPCAARIKLAEPGLWPDFTDEPPAPRAAETPTEPVDELGQSA